MDLYDWIEFADSNEWRRRCPKCGGMDVKFAVHDKSVTGCDVSVLCNECGNHEECDSDGVEILVRKWHGKALTQ